MAHLYYIALLSQVLHCTSSLVWNPPEKVVPSYPCFCKASRINPYRWISVSMEKELQALKKLHQFYLYHDYKTREIAKELNVSTRTVQRWLSGKATPSEKKVKQIRKLLHKKREKS